MKGNWELTREELARAEERLSHPAPGSKIEAAQRYGVDLTLLTSQLRLTPEQRFLRAQEAANAAVSTHGALPPPDDMYLLHELECLLEATTDPENLTYQSSCE